MATRASERDTVTEGAAAAPLARVSPARRPQTGQAPGPWAASTRLAMAIWTALLARLALAAERVPPNAAQVEAENCSPP